MQASVEVQLEFGKFFNVDLFQRGYYQLRCYAKFNPRVMFTSEIGQRSKSRSNDTFRTINGNIAKTKIFQILYKREDVDINDVFIFKIDFLVDILKVEDIFKEVDMQFVVEMWFAEEDVGTDQLDTFQLLCQRCLRLNFDPLKGLHGNVSILFDYFHLSALIMSVHASLVAFKHPLRYNSQPLSSKQSKQSSSSPFTNSLDLTGLELALFGPPIPPNSSNKNIIQAQKLRKLIGCQKHHHMCRYLLSAYESVQSSFELLVSACLPISQQIKLEHVDCVTKLEELVLKCKNLSEMSEAEEEDVLQVVNSDLMNLNTQLSLIWCQYLELVTFNQAINKHLAKENHSQRVKRFAEGFFVREYSKAEALACYDAGHHRHSDISAKVRLSEYFRMVPPLPIECIETDGDHLTLPIIFEDVYSTTILPPMVMSSSEVKRNSIKATPNRWAQRNNSIKNTNARLIAATSIDTTSVVWTTNSSLVTADNKHDNSDNFRRSSNSVGSQDSDSHVPGGSKKKRLSKFRPESLLLLGSGNIGGGVNWQQQQQITGTGQGQKGVQIAFDAPDCQLVGYKKMDANHELAPPTIELGTLSKASDSCESSLPVMRSESFGKDGDSNCFKSEKIDNEEMIGQNDVNDNSNGIYKDYHTNDNIINNNVNNISSVRNQTAMISSSQPSAPSPITEATTSYISPSLHHQKTSSFLISASSLPTLNKDDEDGDVTLQVLNDSSLLVVGAGGGSLPELVGGAMRVNSEDSSLSRSDHHESVSSDKMSPCLDSNPLPRTPSTKSLPGFHDDQFVANNFNEGNNSEDRIETNSHPALPSLEKLPKTDESEPLSMLQSDVSNKDSGYDTLKLLAEEYNVGRRTLRESLREMPDLSIDDLEDNTMVEFEEGEKKDETDQPSGDKTITNSETLPASSSSPSSSSSTSFPRRESRTMQISSHFHSQLVNRRLVSKVTDQTVKFSHAKENLRKSIGYQGHFYSDYLTQTSEDPYFWMPEKQTPPPKHEGIHLIICVHGLDGNSTDLRLVRTYLEMSLSGRGKVDFLMSERNQSDTFSDFEVMTDRLVQEILYHIDLYSIKPARISFIGHSLGNIIIRSALGRKEMVPFLPKLHTFLSLSGPHLGMLFNNSGLVNMGIWLMQKWKKSTSLLQLSLKDHHDPRQTFLYRLSQKQGLKHFRNVLLVGSQQDRYVPFHSSRIELCKAALRDTSGLGSIYTEMVTNLLRPLTDDSPPSNQILASSTHSSATKRATNSPSVFVRYDVSHALTSNTNNLIGRAAHIAVLDSELFIEKFITVSVLKYFL